MRKIDMPLGWVDPNAKAQDTPAEILNKEEPGKKKRKTKDAEPEVVAEAPAEEVAPEPVAEATPEVAAERSDA